MKKRYMRKLNEASNNNGVSSVIGTILMIAVAVSACSAVSLVAFKAIEAVTEVSIDSINTARDNYYSAKNDSTSPTTPDEINNPPKAFSPYPFDGAAMIPLRPRLHITVQDLDRDILVVNFYWYNLSLKTWQRINAEKIDAFSDMVVYCNFSKADSNFQWYNWYVTVKDGQSMFTTPVYAFRTEPVHSP